MFDDQETEDTGKSRTIARPLLTMAIVLTVAWFAIVGVTVASQSSQGQVSGYGIDDIQATIITASR